MTCTCHCEHQCWHNKSTKRKIFEWVYYFIAVGIVYWASGQ